MDWLLNKISLQSDTSTLIFGDKQYTYKELYKKIIKYEAELKKSTQRGDIIAIVSDYNFESIALFFALYLNKNIIVPITSKIDKEVNEKTLASNCDFSITIFGDEIKINKITKFENNHILIENLKSNNNSGLILFSSGSTGTPKAMVHNLDVLVNTFQKEKKRSSLNFMIFLMFDHIGGLNTLLNCITLGVSIIFPNSRNPDDVCELIEKYNVNVLPTSPTFLNLIIINESFKKYNLSSLKLITYGTETMPHGLLIKLKQIFKNCKLLQTFGTSETGISQTISESSESTYLKIEDPNTEFKIINGELYLKSKTQILGYLNHTQEKFTNDGWFKTGDLVEILDNGFMKIIGRNNEIINVGGEKVLPNEVESILFKIPGVIDCIVFGMNNIITGQFVAAKILFDKDLKPSEAKDIVVKFCSDKLEKYKIPVVVKIMTNSEYTDRFKKKRN